MIDSRVPQITGSPQPHTVTPLDGYPSALVDDPVRLVDDTGVLVGSQSTPIGDFKNSTSGNAPKITSSSLKLKLRTDSNAPNTTTRIRH